MLAFPLIGVFYAQGGKTNLQKLAKKARKKRLSFFVFFGGRRFHTPLSHHPPIRLEPRAASIDVCRGESFHKVGGSTPTFLSSRYGYQSHHITESCVAPTTSSVTNIKNNTQPTFGTPFLQARPWLDGFAVSSLRRSRGVCVCRPQKGFEMASISSTLVSQESGLYFLLPT